MTLIELVIALAVVSVLVAVSIPVFSNVRRQSQRTPCLSAIHQSSLAITLYTQDFDGRYPSYRSDPLSAARAHDPGYWHDHFCRATYLAPGQLSWASLVMGYSDDTTPERSGRINRPLQRPHPRLFLCPADPDRDMRPVTSYEYKMWLAEGRSEAEILFPSNLIMLWEQWAFHQDKTISEYDRRGEMNVSFADGHASWIRLSETTSARFNDGPDLHQPFPGYGPSHQHAHQDTLR
jgi:prepilin-type processing-associated H-X9-DG protein